MLDCSFLHSFNRQPLRVTRARVGGTRLYTTASTTELQEYLRLPTGGTTTELARTFGAAIAFVEEICGTTLDTSTLVLTIDLQCITEDKYGDRWIRLPLGPVSGLTSIEDEEATYTSLTLDTSSTPHRVLVPEDVLRDDDCDVTYTAGVADWDDVDQLQQTAVLFAFAHHWQNREAVASTSLYEIPYTLRQAMTLADYRLPF